MADDDNVIRVDFGGASTPMDEPPPPPPEPVSPENDEKLGVFADMIEKGTVLVTLDARRDGVSVPAQFADQMRLNLNFCYLFGIPDFEFDARGVRASLSFGGIDSWCDVPWSAVYMMRSHVENDVMLFPHSIPPEMLAFVSGSGDEEE